MKRIHLLLLSLLIFSCRENLRSPGKPLLELNFNGEVVNQGLSGVSIVGDSLVSYSYSARDTCLNLTALAKYRKPITVNFNEGFSLNDYDGFTVSVWVQKAAGDPDEYTILSQQEFIGDKLAGWELKANKCGNWSWCFKDTVQTWYYVPTLKQAVNDGKMHQVAFSYDKNVQEARLYFDGRNVAVYSMFGNTFELQSTPLRIGISPSSTYHTMDVFDGKIDDLVFWSRPLLPSEIQEVYTSKKGIKIKEPEIGEQLKVMTWDIWQGGIHEGKYVGAERILDVIKSSDPDIVMLQEMAGIGPFLADGLGYYFYHRTNNLGLLSRFPLMESKNVYRQNNIACIKVNLGNGKEIFACPVALSIQPKLDAYIKSGHANPDSILARENEVRGMEITFILGELKHLINTNKNTPLLLGGGFYSGSHLDWTEKNKERNFGLVVDYPVSNHLEREGMKDSYRMVHPDETLDLGYTWSPKFKNALANRMDFIYYYGNNIRPADSYVIDDHLISFPSNHGAVISVFDFEKK